MGFDREQFSLSLLEALPLMAPIAICGSAGVYLGYVMWSLVLG